jgi:hypothetical protein
VAEPRIDQCARAHPLAKLLADLDRCPHGRHEGDTCAGWSAAEPERGCPGGYSLGNPLLPTGVRIGTDYAARPIFMPPRGRRHDPQAWFEQPLRTVPDGAQPIGLDEAARALGTTVALVEFWATSGAQFMRYGDEVLLCHGDRVVGRRPVNAGGYPAGPYTVIIHERQDDEGVAGTDGTGGN